MKSSFRIIIVLLLAGVIACDPPESADNNGTSDPLLGDHAIFSVPSSMTGASVSSSNPSTRAVLSSSKSQVAGFFTYARDQIRFANDAAQGVKQIINDLDTAGAFDLSSSVVIDTNNGDRLAWTVGPDMGASLAANQFILEWWRLQSTPGTYLKLFELHLNEYVLTPEINVSGVAILYPTADPATLDSWHGEPEWVQITFDSNDDSSNASMKIEMQGFLGTGLRDTGVKQNGILYALQTDGGFTDVFSSVRVPGISSLNYEKDGSSNAETELRYYIFSGRDAAGSATVNLAMPLDSYGPAPPDDVDNTVFDSDTIGDVITEYVADQLRANHDFSGTGGHFILDALADLDGVTLASPYTVDPPVPATADIASSFATAYAANPDQEVLENYDYLMNVENPVYFNGTSYVTYGARPSNEYADASDPQFTQFAINQWAVDNLSIGFTGPNSGDIPPDVTNP